MQSVERALTLLRAIASADEPLGLAALQRATGLHKTIVFRLLRTLEAHGFIEQDPDTARFSIGVAAFEVGQAYGQQEPLLRIAEQPMRELVAGSPHGAYLGVLDDFEVVYVSVVESSGPLRVHITPGERVPAYSTAFGKVLLAELPDEEIRAGAARHGLRALTERTITEPGELVAHLARVRRDGFAVNDAETYDGIGSIAAAIRDRRGRAIASISLSYATSLMRAQDMPAWAERTTRCAATISARLGGIDLATAEGALRAG